MFLHSYFRSDPHWVYDDPSGVTDAQATVRRPQISRTKRGDRVVRPATHRAA